MSRVELGEKEATQWEKGKKQVLSEKNDFVWTPAVIPLPSNPCITGI
jgi:hypothetical protein